jgi:hypothetical protein
MSFLHYLCLLAYSGVQQHIVLCLCFDRLVDPMSPVSLDCPFLITLFGILLTFAQYVVEHHYMQANTNNAKKT